MLVRLTYASRASHSVSAELIREILDSSQRNNPAHGLTGILCCNADVFLQALEGPRAAVNALYNRLAEDTRHKDLTILAYEEINARHYGNWSMGWAGAKLANRELFLKYSGSDRFDPFSMNAAQVGNLLLELSETASAIKSPVLS
ncbi:BLUF domain-containing protein [Pseudomonas sp. UBA2684]|uniref:BLUF domain-containing protein n=1 Tax=Pseudomonas sp. UBA2684 TaxID=1947311 RepID=UPI000E96F4CC|nr:BLUF domain-containing protein [Pseudomonas sp. UBA2684]HBX56873.1 blue light sensor protein [Pseudomonas sp.]|tara:strand:- start:4449 stop:4883 length:435 start_codon:yes stop_codon:yes gene_type:complete